MSDRVECVAAVLPIQAWPVPVDNGWVEVRCLCGYASMPMPRVQAEQLAAAHERGPVRA